MAGSTEKRHRLPEPREEESRRQGETKKGRKDMGKGEKKERNKETRKTRELKRKDGVGERREKRKAEKKDQRKG